MKIYKILKFFQVLNHSHNTKSYEKLNISQRISHRSNSINIKFKLTIKLKTQYFTKNITKNISWVVNASIRSMEHPRNTFAEI